MDYRTDAGACLLCRTVRWRSWRTPEKPRSYSEVYNDLDGEVVNLFRVLRDPELNQRLQDACCLTPYARDEFCNAQEPATDPIERARRMVVRACMGFGSAAGVGGQSGFRSDSKRKYATAAHLWERYPANLAAVCLRLQGVIIENKDAPAVMRAHDADTTLYYIDPPYVPDTRVQSNRYYAHEMTIEGHEQLLAVSKTMTGMVMISGYDTEVYNDMLTGWVKRRKPHASARGEVRRFELNVSGITRQRSRNRSVQHEPQTPFTRTRSQH